MQYWLMKSEPDVWSIDQQIKAGEKGADWDGVRNYQAANNLKKMQKGDFCFFYHSNIGKEIVNNKESTVKKIINYCQLKWSEKCLNHHNYVSPIKTLSLNQASKPVYSTSIGSSNNYDIYLREMFNNLSLQINK